MSDHGKRADISKVMTEMKVHVLLMVVDENISYRKVNNIFSIINYLDLIKYIMNPSDDLYSKMFQNRYAFYQELDTYNMSRIQTVITSAVIYASAYALRGIITENDKYIITGYGNEFYYILPDEDNNLVEDSKYIERINELRELAGNNFLDIYKYEKFRGSRILYEHFKLKPIGKQKE